MKLKNWESLKESVKVVESLPNNIDFPMIKDKIEHGEPTVQNLMKNENEEKKNERKLLRYYYLDYSTNL